MKVFGLFITLALIFCTHTARATILRFSEVEPGIFRGGQPELIADYAFLKKLGVRTIINLRTSEDEIQLDYEQARTHGMGFRNYPLSGMSYPSEGTVNRILASLKDSKLLPVFIHCQVGKDRTGLVIGLHRVFHQHWSAKRAYEEMLNFDFEPRLTGLTDYFWDHVPQTKRQQKK